MRPKSPTQSAIKKKSKPPSNKKLGSGGGKGNKLIMLAKSARFLSLSVFNITFKVLVFSCLGLIWREVGKGGFNYTIRFMDNPAN